MVMTVLGEIHESQLGVTSPHEHIFIELTAFFEEEPLRDCESPATAPVTMDKLGILIMQDIFCGVVPMGAENRAWRQRTGRLSQYLSKEANQVSRIFCGLEQRLK